VSTDGNTAYFASNHLDGVGGWDIYSFPLHYEAKPERVLFLKGELMDENGQVLEDVELEIKNLKTNKVTTVKVDAGTYVSALALEGDADVLITVKKAGFAFNSTFIAYDDTSFVTPTEFNIELQSLEKGKSFNISNIFFPTNSYEINDLAQEVLIEFSSYLKLNNSLVIEVNGFTDDIGDFSDNQILSENRASAVRDLILKNGISADRIKFNGFGELNPIVPNKDEKSRGANRRTEFRIISK
jgi:outer membrane protein OmpA-like peptidoglycan-associated protein